MRISNTLKDRSTRDLRRIMNICLGDFIDEAGKPFPFELIERRGLHRLVKTIMWKGEAGKGLDFEVVFFDRVAVLKLLQSRRGH